MYVGGMEWVVRGDGNREPGARKRTGLEDSGISGGIVQWVRDKLGLEPDEVQARLLEAPGKRVLLNCTRQWGKSTIAAAKAVHSAYFQSRSLILVVAPTERQSGELIRKGEEFAGRLGVRVKRDGRNANSLEFPDGSRLVGLPGREATIRGFSRVSLVVIDEAARVEDDVYRAVRPMLAVSGGAIWLLSTPNGKRGFFWEAWARGGEIWERVKVTAAECPRITQEYLEEERRELGDMWFRQEYFCEFTEAVSAVFSRELIERAFTDEVEPLFDGGQGPGARGPG